MVTGTGTMKIPKAAIAGVGATLSKVGSRAPAQLANRFAIPEPPPRPVMGDPDQLALQAADASLIEYARAEARANLAIHQDLFAPAL